MRRLLATITATAVLAIPSVTASATPGSDPLPRVPLGFAITPYVHTGTVSTSIAFGPDTRTGHTGGTRLYAADFVNGQILAIDDAGGVGTPPSVFATGLHSPLGVLVATDGTVFASDTEDAARNGPFGTRVYGRVWRLQDADHDGVAENKAVVLKDLPNGRHNTNGLAFGPDGLLYVANGNSTDDGTDGGELDAKPWSGSVVRVDPAATGVSLASIDADPDATANTLVAQGMRNLYDLAFSPIDPTSLLIPMNGTDDARRDADIQQPDTGILEDSDDLLLATDVDDSHQVGVDPSGNPILEPTIDDFGFPSCLYNAERKGNFEPYTNPNPDTLARYGPCPVSTVPRPAGNFGLHVSADGMAFQRTAAWGPDYQNDLFVAEFGNFFGNDITGHKVVRVELDASGRHATRVSEFLTGAAPLDVAFDAAGAMYVMDFSGTIFKVTKVADVPQAIEVDISAYQFLPPALVIPEGTTVKWVNKDVLGLTHNVRGLAAVRADGTQDDGKEINSPDMPVTYSHSFRFDIPGTWVYICAIHPAEMHGTITVVPAGS